MGARPARLLTVLFLALAGCGGETKQSAAIEVVAESSRRWTGVAVTQDGRIFVNFPRWSDDVPISVAELVDGKPTPYPDATWNGWSEGQDPATHFVCVQSVTVDDEGALWILDPANPGFRGVVPGGPKLQRHDLGNGSIRTYTFDETAAPKNSYLNDVRIDTENGAAYITDSGAGALVVLDLDSGEARRVLDKHLSTKAESIEITIDGKPWQRDGKTPQVHADGIALSPDGAWLYYQALTGRTMFRVPTNALLEAALSPAELARRVERVAESGVCDGLIFDAAGNLYLSSLEESAINRLDSKHVRSLVVQHAGLSWPDSFARGPDGWIYVTTALIHRGDEPREPFRLWRFKP